MAIVFMDGFDIYDDAADVLQAGWSRESTSANTFSTTLGRFGGGCLTNSTQANGWVCPFGSGDSNGVLQGTTCIVAFAYYHDGLGGPSDELCILQDTGIRTIFQLDHTAGGDIIIEGNSSVLGATTGGPLTPDTWHWIEVKVTLGTNGTNGAIELRVNEVVRAAFTNVDTFGTTGNRAIQVFFFGSNGSSRFDDIVLIDDTGTDLTDYPGDVRIDTLTPDADGGTVAWTAVGAASNFQAVDDPDGSSDDDTTYIESNTVAQESRFDVGALPTTPTSVLAVQVRPKARKDNAGSRTFRTLVNASAVEETGPTRGLSTNYSWVRGGVYEKDPGGVAWNGTKIGTIQVGVEIVT